MQPNHVTAFFILAVIGLIIAYDLLALGTWGAEATISRVLRHLAQRWALFPYLVAFGMGALFGHLFL
jgi:hypothetical protein